jgi:two-component system response regulator
MDILVVDDCRADVRLTEEAFKESHFRTRLHVAEDGQAAIDFLRRRRGYEDAPRPALVLLDLNLPRKDGREVLAEVKSDLELKAIPVIVLTTSAMETDVLRSYELHANAFVTKPLDLPRFLCVLNSLSDFWLFAATLPEHIARKTA